MKILKRLFNVQIERTEKGQAYLNEFQWEHIIKMPQVLFFRSLRKGKPLLPSADKSGAFEERSPRKQSWTCSYLRPTSIKFFFERPTSFFKKKNGFGSDRHDTELMAGRVLGKAWLSVRYTMGHAGNGEIVWPFRGWTNMLSNNSKDLIRRRKF